MGRDRLWDGGCSPRTTTLATLEGHISWVEGALALPDGRLLSWSGDATLRLWDGPTGTAIATVAQAAAHRTHPDLHRAWREAEAPTVVCSAAAALGGRGHPRLWLYAPIDTAIPWHADGNWIADHLLPDGTLVARRDKHLAILHLHHGRRRVSIEEAEALLAPS